MHHLYLTADSVDSSKLFPTVGVFITAGCILKRDIEENVFTQRTFAVWNALFKWVLEIFDYLDRHLTRQSKADC